MEPTTTLPQLQPPQPTQPSPLAEMARFVDGPRLLEILWDTPSRPSLRWLRSQQKRRSIPFSRIGHRVWFIPNQVLKHMAEWQTLRPKAQGALRRPSFRTEGKP
jgi:hypothetical protein